MRGLVCISTLCARHIYLWLELLLETQRVVALLCDLPEVGEPLDEPLKEQEKEERERQERERDAEKTSQAEKHTHYFPAVHQCKLAKTTDLLLHGKTRLYHAICSECRYGSAFYTCEKCDSIIGEYRIFKKNDESNEAGNAKPSSS